jgi:membrane protein implicated in regulation of membrane protease activity
MEWWSSLKLAEQSFYAIALLSSAVMAVQLLLSLIGLGADGHDLGVGTEVPGGVDVDHPDMEAHSSGLGMLSVKTITAFLVGFGWTGAVLTGYGWTILLAILGATAVGGAFMVLVFWLMRSIYRLSETGTVDERNAEGKAGTAYLPVPPKRSGTGQVQVIVQGRTREIPCLTDDERGIPTGTPVRVTKVLEGGTALVERMEVDHA